MQKTWNQSQNRLNPGEVDIPLHIKGRGFKNKIITGECCFQFLCSLKVPVSVSAKRTPYLYLPRNIIPPPPKPPPHADLIIWIYLWGIQFQDSSIPGDSYGDRKLREGRAGESGLGTLEIVQLVQMMRKGNAAAALSKRPLPLSAKSEADVAQ